MGFESEFINQFITFGTRKIAKLVYNYNNCWVYGTYKYS